MYFSCLPGSLAVSPSFCTTTESLTVVTPLNPDPNRWVTSPLKPRVLQLVGPAHSVLPCLHDVS